MEKAVFDDFIVYKVMRNEDFLDVSKKFNVPVQVLYKENNKTETFEGDRVIVSKESKILHVVKPAETLQQIANMYNVSIEHIKRNNTITEIFIGQMLSI